MQPLPPTSTRKHSRIRVAVLTGLIALWAQARGQAVGSEATFTLQDGERLTGTVLAREGGRVTIHSPLLGDVTLPESAIAMTSPTAAPAHPPRAESPPPSSAAPMNATASAESAPTAGDVTRMSAFTVDTSLDRGYSARNTLSAYGTSTSLLNTAQNIDIANQTLIKDLNAQVEYDAVAYAAAGVTRRSYNAGDDQYIWGFRSNIILLDGLPYNIQGGPVGATYDTDRIEVIKGPAGLLFGQDAFTGGTINIVTRQPTATPHAEVQATLGSFDFRKFEAHLSGPILPRLRYRLDAGTTDTNESKENFTYYHDRFVGGAIDYDLSNHATLSVSASYYHQNYLYPMTMLDPHTGQLLPAPSSFTLQEPWATNPNTLFRTEAKLVVQITPNLESRTYVSYENIDVNDFRPVWSTLNVATTTLTGYADNPQFANHDDMIGQDFAWNLPVAFIHQKLQFGFEQRNDNLDRQEPEYALAPLNYSNPVYSYPTGPSISSGAGVYNNTKDRISGIYAEDVLGFWDDRINAVVGGRYNNYFQATGAPVPGTGGTQTVQNQSKNVGRLGLLVHPFPDATLYYSHAQAFLFNSGVDAYNRPLPASTGISDEGGGKLALFNGGLLLTASVFDLRLTNVRTQYTETAGQPQPGTLALETIGQETNHGYDLAVNVSHAAGPGEIDGIATLYHGNVRDNFGNRVIGPANNTYSLLGVYKFTQGPFSGLDLGLGTRYQGSRDGYGFAANSGLPAAQWGSYTDINAFISYRWKGLKGQLNVDDLANRTWIEGGEGPFWVYPNQGRMIKFSLSYGY